MKLKVAIELAVEQGWRPKGLNVDGRAISWIKQAVSSRSKFIERYLLDPKFFQALGKGMGWGGMTKDPDEGTVEWDFYFVCPRGSIIYGEEMLCEHECQFDLDEMIVSWKWYWYKFIDHLAEGKTIESWFEQFNPPKP